MIDVQRQTNIKGVVEAYATQHAPRLCRAWTGLQLALRGLGAPEYVDPSLLEYEFPEFAVELADAGGDSGLRRVRAHGMLATGAEDVFASIDALRTSAGYGAGVLAAAQLMEPVEAATASYELNVRPVGAGRPALVRFPRPSAAMSLHTASGQLGLDPTPARALQHFETIYREQAHKMQQWTDAIGAAIV